MKKTKLWKLLTGVTLALLLAAGPTALAVTEAFTIPGHAGGGEAHQHTNLVSGATRVTALTISSAGVGGSTNVNYVFTDSGIILPVSTNDTVRTAAASNNNWWAGGLSNIAYTNIITYLTNISFTNVTISGATNIYTVSNINYTVKNQVAAGLTPWPVLIQGALPTNTVITVAIPAGGITFSRGVSWTNNVPNPSWGNITITLTHEPLL